MPRCSTNAPPRQAELCGRKLHRPSCSICPLLVPFALEIQVRLASPIRSPPSLVAKSPSSTKVNWKPSSRTLNCPITFSYFHSQLSTVIRYIQNQEHSSSTLGLQRRIRRVVETLQCAARSTIPFPSRESRLDAAPTELTVFSPVNYKDFAPSGACFRSR